MSDITQRLRQLSDAVTREDWKAFSMRVPAEPDRDADLVLMSAADEIERLRVEIAELRGRYSLASARVDALWRDNEHMRAQIASWDRAHGIITIDGVTHYKSGIRMPNEETP